MSSVLNLWAGMTGTVLDFAGTTPPDGWLLCAGQTVSRTTYANLFAAIGTTFGVGDGSSTFHLPDGRGRVCAGRDDMGGSAAGRLTTAGAGVDGAALGGSGGLQTHQLTAVQNGTHTHTVSDPGHGHSVYDPTHTHGVYDPGHSHTYNRVSVANGQGSDVGTANNHTTGDTSKNATGISLYGAATGVSIYSSATGIALQTNGAGAAHNNTQPTIVFNKIIKI